MGANFEACQCYPNGSRFGGLKIDMEVFWYSGSSDCNSLRLLVDDLHAATLSGASHEKDFIKPKLSSLTRNVLFHWPWLVSSWYPT